MPETRRWARMASKEEKPDDNDVIYISGDEEGTPLTEMEIQRKKLRQRWELASILNFFHVFEPVIQSNLKISAEEIETALIEANVSLAQLHIVLLKGVAPASKMLNVPNAWLSVLAKKLAVWWPWVAEGDFPLTAAKGEEMNRYKELDPTIRLFILKALCEMRADRDDIVSYINDTIKDGTGHSTFQKEKLGQDGRGTLYWYDGNEDIGHRLYKEVQVFELRPKVKGTLKGLGIISQWETLATNFEEFHKVVNEFSSSKVQLEVAVAKAVQANVIPALEKLQKKKEKVLKQQRRQEMLLPAFRNNAITRTGRTRRTVNYRFEEYYKSIKEAIEVMQHRKIAKVQMLEDQQKVGSNPVHSSDSESIESDTDTEKHQGYNEDHNANDEHEDANHDSNCDVNSLNDENNEVGKNKLKFALRTLNGWAVRRPKASLCSRIPASTVDMNASEGMSLTTRQRLRQRPAINTFVESDIVPDSEDEKMSKDVRKRVKRISGNLPQAAGADEDDFSS